MTTTTEERGKLNLFATEPRMYIDHDYAPLYRIIMNEKAERINGLAAMLGVVAALGAYGFTGQIIPGIW
tara:strand:- start:8706 stop:8912 length:207 start_codon:yes stop_codon:yes gene_type:complete